MSSTPEHFSVMPHTVIAGAPKSGTSSLFFWLADHPEVCPSRKKETHFLRDNINKHNRDLNIHEHGLESYSSLFRHCGQGSVRLEATPRYFFEKTPVKVLSSFHPLPSILFILRKPSDQLYSHYKFARYRRKIIDLSFAEYLDIENNDLKWELNHREAVKYADHLEKWVKAFGKENIRVYLFEEMQEDPRAFMKGVAKDLDIDPDFYKGYEFGQRNPTVTVKNKWLHQLGNQLQSYLPNSIQKKLLPLYLKINTGKAPSITEEEQALKREMDRYYAPDNQRLKALFPHLDLSRWE